MTDLATLKEKIKEKLSCSLFNSAYNKEMHDTFMQTYETCDDINKFPGLLRAHYAKLSELSANNLKNTECLTILKNKLYSFASAWLVNQRKNFKGINQDMPFETILSNLESSTLARAIVGRDTLFSSNTNLKSSPTSTTSVPAVSPSAVCVIL